MKLKIFPSEFNPEGSNKKSGFEFEILEKFFNSYGVEIKILNEKEEKC